MANPCASAPATPAQNTEASITYSNGTLVALIPFTIALFGCSDETGSSGGGTGTAPDPIYEMTLAPLAQVRTNGDSIECGGAH